LDGDRSFDRDNLLNHGLSIELPSYGARAAVMFEEGSAAPACIQYMGLPGISEDCKEAIMRLIQFGDNITSARILSCDRTHCLLLTINVGDTVAIKSGFASGYGGEGPTAFSFVLQLLEAHGAEIDEVDVTQDLVDRVDMSSLTEGDLGSIERARRVSPRRANDYVSQRDWDREHSGELWQEFPPVIPFAIVDRRIVDLAKRFWEGPDEHLLTAYRRLEDIVRKRIGSAEHGAKLFSSAFLGDKATLGWPGMSNGEQVGRANLFTAVYNAYRNPRAHRELGHDAQGQLAEFLLLNHLYGLERAAVDGPVPDLQT
jgi:hypothetical protein